MDAVRIISDVKSRLVAMANDPPYVYRNTPRDLIEQEQRRLTTFVGFTEAEVAGAEARLGVRFPTVFRTFLLEMGKSPGDEWHFLKANLLSRTELRDLNPLIDILASSASVCALAPGARSAASASWAAV